MLLRKIEQFLQQSGIAWTKFGRIVAHDPRLVGDMRNGRQPRPALAQRIEGFIQEWIASNALTENTLNGETSHAD